MSRARAVTLLVLFGLTACVSKAPPTGRAASDEAKQVLQKYVDAMKREDFAHAIALRCSAARPRVDEARYKSDLERLTATLGTIQRVDVSVIGETKIVPIATLPGRVDVSYRLTTSKGQRGSLVGVTSIEGGRRVLCGWGTTEASGLFPATSAIIAAAPPIKSSAQDLVAVRAPAGSKPFEDVAVPQDPTDAGQVGGWTRAWRLGDFGGVRVTAMSYSGSDSALQSAEVQLRRLQGIGVETFKIPGAKAAVGLRALTYTDLWLQDDHTPPYIDEVYAVFGSMLVNVGVSNLTTSSHAIAIAMMQEIAARV